MARVLGLSCGAPEGSAEILLRSALAGAPDSGHEVTLVRLNDLRIPFGAAVQTGPDDAWWFWEQLMESDALIVSAPIYGRSVPGNLRLLADRLLGPNADAAFVEELLELRAAGREAAVPFRVDERVLKPRVAGFICVGGSLADHWKSLALPLMHAMTFSMHIPVADQLVFAGAGTPQSIVLDPGALARSAALGEHVISQIGEPYAAVRYLGDTGACPMCHLDVIVLGPGDSIECATCGAAGRLVNGRTEFPPDGRAQSVISMDEKRAHFFEVQETAARQGAQAAEIRARAQDVLMRSPFPTTQPAEVPA